MNSIFSGGRSSLGGPMGMGVPMGMGGPMGGSGGPVVIRVGIQPRLRG